MIAFSTLTQPDKVHILWRLPNDTEWSQGAECESPSQAEQPRTGPRATPYVCYVLYLFSLCGNALLVATSFGFGYSVLVVLNTTSF